MKIKILTPSCNIDTVRDGRGGIFTWIPAHKLMEFNLLYFKPGRTRGNHYHPEFHEYFLVVEGEGVMITKDSEDAPEEVIHMGKGMCSYNPLGVVHTFYAITPVTAISMLSKPWDDCEKPIIHMHVMTPPPVHD